MSLPKESPPEVRGAGGVLEFSLFWAALLSWIWIAPNDYLLSLGGTFFINLLLIASLNLLIGYAGQVSLAQAAFFGIGAYATGIVTTRFGLPPAAGVVAAVVLNALAALLVGIPTLRLRGHYLAMATVGLNVILSVLFVGLVDLTGGPNGLFGIPSFNVLSVDFASPGRFYLLAWAAAGAVMLGLLFLTRSRVGRALRAIAASDIAAACLGIPVLRYKVIVFSLCAGIAGLAGALYAHQSNFVSPDTFSFFTSVLLLVMVAIGGFGRYWGPVFGALIYTALPEVMRTWHDTELLLFGVAMIVVVGFFPGGLAASFARLFAWRGR